MAINRNPDRLPETEMPIADDGLINTEHAMILLGETDKVLFGRHWIKTGLLKPAAKRETGGLKPSNWYRIEDVTALAKDEEKIKEEITVDFSDYVEEYFRGPKDGR